MRNKEFEVKTNLSEGHFIAMQQVIESKGMTQAGYIRHLILKDMYESQDLVSQMNEITDRAKRGQK